MFKSIIFSFIFLAAFSCTDSGNSNTGIVENIDAAQFSSLMESSPEKNVIDVRTDVEVAGGVIPNATQIDLSRTDFRESISSLDKSKPVFVYCAVGGRSSMASEVLEQAGFEKVYNLSGGINAWQAAGLPLGKLK
jgi:rhodanese-related sulfurtransferase